MCDLFLRLAEQADVVLENYDIIIQALGGLMSLTGEEGGRPDR